MAENNTFPSKLDMYREQKEKDEKFRLIPDDLITEYLDLHQQKSELEQQHQLRVDDLIQEHKRRKKLILLDLEANCKKMEEISGLDDFSLSKRLPPRRDIEPPF